MAIEIERKFLVRDDGWTALVTATRDLRQGYLAAAPDRSIRVRIDGPDAWLTLKFGVAGPVREEFEYAVPLADAEAMFAHASGTIAKRRNLVLCSGRIYEIDVFAGPLAGLVIAELETPETIANADLPDWLGREVTDDPRYYNAVLARDGLPGTEQ